MNFRKNFVFLLLGSLLFTACHSVEPWKNSSLPFDERASDLLKQLTIEEKVTLMTNNSAGIDRLGIPPYEWWNEALHGVARAGKATVFPQAIGLAATFDDEGVYETFGIISDEARAKHHEAVRNGERKRYQGLTFWTPNINIFRDPRWGRGQETYGEDPYLTGMMGVAAVRGLQGDGTEKYDKTHACAKHFAVHSGPERNRHSFDAKDISKRDLYETYLPAFKKLVTEAGVKEVMCAYNRFEGDPCCGSRTLLMDILRNEWDYDGIVVSDCGAIDDFYKKNRHETHPTVENAVADAVIAGTDLECGSSYKAMTDACKAGLISEEQINVSVLRLLKARFQLGLFDEDHEVSWASIPASVVESDEHKAKALEMARKSLTLLQNNNRVLPLSKELKKVAVLGPNADNKEMLWANYNGIPDESITILQGIRSKLPEASVIYEKGCDWVNDKAFFSYFNHCMYNGQQGFGATFRNTVDFTGDEAAKMQIVAPLSFSTGGNTVFAAGVNLKNFSAHFESVFTAPATENITLRISGADGYKLFVDDEQVMEQRRPSWELMFSKRDHVMKVVKGKEYRIRLEFFKGDGSTPASLTFDVGYTKEVDYDAVAASVKDADAIIFVGGITSALEGEEMPVEIPGFKGGDRTGIDLPAVQTKMLETLGKTGKPVVFVLCAGSAMALAREAVHADAILNAWYPGQQGGLAVADVLFGDYNPAGRLPLTFYASTDQLPDFEDYHMDKGRTYRYFKGKPLFPFGHGLSYTAFAYDDAQLSKDAIEKTESVTLTVNLTNSGTTDGEEVVQVYIRNLQDIDGPAKSLRAFKRIPVKAGATASTDIHLSPSAFEFFDPQSEQLTVKAGTYEIFYGGSSADAALKKTYVTIK
ncbi:MAG: glycoside hydrolase family 3 C-terminal domain-containing protein [Bacteroidales bacterium]|nr:glycoside hydrolase family 3 C-terminal domain-containing protein [Bacteroidales bacterium]